MRTFQLSAAAALALVAAPASADTICEWMDFSTRVEAAGTAAAGFSRGGEHARVQSEVALAMFEALNAIDRRYASYLGFAAAEPGASQQSAAVTAAYQVLLAHYPAQKTSLDESYGIAMATVADAAAREKGQRIGKAAADAAMAAAKLDPATPLSPYRPRTQAGVWVPTQLPIFTPAYLALKPWFLERADAVRPAPPPAMTSERYAKDLNEVKAVGALKTASRTEHQTLMARYRITPDMLPALRLVADRPSRRLVENARLFALYHMINDDALLAVAEAKYHYNYWRPITSIRNAEDDGNPATAADPGWEPLIATPNHPEYPCGHCIGAAATAELMKAEQGNTPASGVRVASRSIPNAAVQTLPSWDKWVEEVSYSRTLGGVHYRFSNEAGEEMGRNIARLALAKAMQPLRGTKTVIRQLRRTR